MNREVAVFGEEFRLVGHLSKRGDMILPTHDFHSFPNPDTFPVAFLPLRWRCQDQRRPYFETIMMIVGGNCVAVYTPQAISLRVMIVLVECFVSCWLPSP